MASLRARRGLWVLCVAVAATHCRDYSSETSAAPSSGGSAVSPPPTGGVGANERGEGGRGGVAEAGSSSLVSAGEAGHAAEVGPGGHDGTAGAPPSLSPSDSPEVGPSPGSAFGAVRVLLDGEPRCGGTLVTNAWILTADQCVPSAASPDAIEVGFGADATRFEQTRTAVEIVRFPGNDGNADRRGRDLLLLGVDAPFVIDGSESRHHIALDTLLPQSVLSTQRCVGWDLRPDPTSDTTKLHSELLTGVTLEYDVEIDARAAGHRLWWTNSAADSNDGVLPMPDDIGTGCFFTMGQSSFLAAVHSGNPARLRDGGENDGREAFAQVVADPEVHGWLARTLFGVEEHALDLVGDPGSCSLSPGTFELFATDGDGNLAHLHFEGSFEPRAPLEPPEGAPLSNHRPGAFCTPSGGIELFTVDVEGRVFRRTRSASDQSWSNDWERLSDATTKVSSGLGVAGALDDHFHVFAAGESGELRHAEYDDGWTGNWNDLGGALAGTPVVRVPQEGRADTFVRTVGGRIGQMWSQNGVWQRWSEQEGSFDGDPGIVSWRPDRVDLLTRSAAGNLLWKVYDFAWGEWADTKLPVPPGSFFALSSELGHLDLLVSGEGRVWHATWPRPPAAVK